MTVPPKETPAGKLWTCDACGTTSLWTPEHQWYGSLRLDPGRLLARAAPQQLDDGRWPALVVTCSVECRQAAAALGLVPEDAELLAS